MEDMSAVNKHRKLFYRGLVLALLLLAFVFVASPMKAYAATPLLTYQCVGKDVAVETARCSGKQRIDGGAALISLKRSLSAYDGTGDASAKTKRVSEIMEYLNVLEYPSGSDPIAAARSLTGVVVPNQEAAAEKPLICDGFLANTFNPMCWARTIAAVLSSFLIAIAAWALAIAGVLFNWTIMNAVILFKDVIFNPISSGINIGWTAFRDIANIVIIGVFAFIAISIILGNKTFGDKKLVARVLVIAILINFSLLFTKMIIDASNFTAGQFYAATQDGGEKTLSQIIDENQPGKSTGLSNGVSPFDGYAQKGIAGQFINFLGVTNVADTYASLKEVGEANDNGFLILVHALFATILLLGAAIVLFYGAFLLISRAIILIFLLLTSAIAFASHLIPKMSDGQFGWSAWWKSLLGSAVLAPLLMIFLYITLVIAGNLTGGAGTLASAPSSTVGMTAAVGATSQVAAGADATQTSGAPPVQQAKGTLGNLISKSATKGDINALFNYLIVLGLLFGSFKVASSFSSKIGGFNFAQIAAAIPLTMGSRLAGFALRNTAGRGAALIEKAMGDRLGEARRELTQIDPERDPRRYAEVHATARRLEGRQRLAGWFTKQNYDLAQSTLGKQIAKQTGVKSPLSPGDAKASFAESTKKSSEAASVRAEAAFNLTRSDQEKIRAKEKQRQDAIFKQQAENLEQQREALKQQADAAAAVAQASRQQADTNKQTLQQQKAAAERQAQAVERQAKAKKDDLESAVKELQRSANHGDPTAVAEIAQKRSAINAEDQKIKNARSNVDNLTQRIETFEKNAVRDSKTSEEKNHAYKEKSREYDAHLDPKGEAARNAYRRIEQAVSDAIEGSKRPGAEAAERYATNMLSRMLGRQTYKGQKAKGAYEEKWAKAKLRKNLEPLIEEIKAQQAGTAESSAAPAGSPPTGSTSGTNS